MKKIFLCFVSFFMFGFVSVRAEIIDDVKFDVVNEGSWRLDIYVDKYYGVLYSTNDNVSDVITDSSYFDSSSYYISEKNLIESSGYNEYASMYGDVYVTLYEYDDNLLVYNRVSKTILVERKFMDYGSRMEAGFYSQDGGVDLIIHDIYNRNSNLNIKIGEVKDDNILYNFSKTSDYSEILEYVKKDVKPILDFSENLSKFSNFYGKYDSKEIIDGNYYYIYLEIDTENGKFYPLDEIIISQAKNGNLSSDFDFEFELDDNTKDDEQNSIVENNKDILNDANNNVSVKDDNNIITNPNTGINDFSFPFLALSVIVGLIYFTFKKNKFNKI